MNKRLMHAVMIAMTCAPMLASDKPTSEFESKQRSAALNALAGDDKPLTDKEAGELRAAQNILFRLKTKNGNGTDVGPGLPKELVERVCDLRGNFDVQTVKMFKKGTVMGTLSPDATRFIGDAATGEPSTTFGVHLMTSNAKKQLSQLGCTAAPGVIFSPNGTLAAYCLLSHVGTHVGILKQDETGERRDINGDTQVYSKNITADGKFLSGSRISHNGLAIMQLVDISFGLSPRTTGWFNSDIDYWCAMDFLDNNACVSLGLNDDAGHRVLQVWDIRAMQPQHKVVMPGSFHDVCSSSATSYCLAGGNAVSLIDMRMPAGAVDQLPHNNVQNIRCSLDANSLASLDHVTGTVKLWDVKKATEKGSYTASKKVEMRQYASLSADGNTIALPVGKNGEVQILTYADSKKTLREAHKAAVLKTVKQDKPDAGDGKTKD